MGVPKQCMLEPCPQWCRSSCPLRVQAVGLLSVAVPRVCPRAQEGSRAGGSVCFAGLGPCSPCCSSLGVSPAEQALGEPSLCVTSLLCGSSISFPMAVTAGEIVMQLFMCCLPGWLLVYKPASRRLHSVFYQNDFVRVNFLHGIPFMG